MQQKSITANIKVSPISFSFKYGSILLLFLLSTLVVACGANSDTTAGAAGTPEPTTKININSLASPTPTLPPQWCGVWLLNASPTFDENGFINIYGKFTLNKDGNPQGIPQANVTFNVHWGDGSFVPVPASTTSDGLAVASLSMRGHAAALNRLSLITATFTSGNVTCTVDEKRPQSFVVINGVKVKGTVNPTTKPGRKPRN
ncbi:hypothetical protein KDA_02260 [Dictyobacter alpinus]|uniref:Uncharacterized protein n=1 Tax=Dictyobacter alpinus TaxID=2014873 RepID=A0A402B071_9CHLR|nr:hypothetical protein [Dictyobacter alpinus]GCE24742.1 hypothetical protein KDA_02260 [Dictyobacter alpinus]